MKFHHIPIEYDVHIINSTSSWFACNGYLFSLIGLPNELDFPSLNQFDAYSIAGMEQ